VRRTRCQGLTRSPRPAGPAGARASTAGARASHPAVTVCQVATQPLAVTVTVRAGPGSEPGSAESARQLDMIDSESESRPGLACRESLAVPVPRFGITCARAAGRLVNVIFFVTGFRANMARKVLFS
jgi:hypothetical protein